jgi:hypothetical protein
MRRSEGGATRRVKFGRKVKLPAELLAQARKLIDKGEVHK